MTLGTVEIMLLRLPVALGLACLTLLPALVGCSSSHRKDVNYGTDAGANYQIPEAATFANSGETGANAETDAETGTETAAEMGAETAAAGDDAPLGDPADPTAQDSGADSDS